MDRLYDSQLMYTEKACDIENEIDNLIRPLVEKYSKEVDIFDLKNLLSQSVNLIITEQMYVIQSELVKFER